MFKKILIGLAALFLLLASAAAATFYLVDPNLLKPYAERAISAAIGRPFSIQGDLEIERGWIIRVRAHDVHVGNAEWAEQADMASVETVEASLDLWDLLTRQQVTLPEVILDRPIASLERNAEGQANWQLGASPDDAPSKEAPAERGNLPFIGKLVVRDATIDYRDAVTGQEISSRLDKLEAASQGEAGRMKVSAAGQVDDLPLELEGTFGSYQLLAESAQPFPIEGTLTLGRSRIALDGTIADPANLEGVDLDLDLAAQDLTKVLVLAGLPAPEIPPFDLDGHLTRKDGEVRMEDLTGKVGDSSIKGWVAFGSTGDRPKLSGDLTSEQFDLDDLAGLIGRPPATGPGETASPRQEQKAEEVEDSPYVIPDTQLSSERWQALDVDMRFRGERVNAGKLPLEAVEFRIVMDQGRLRLDPLQATIAGSSVGGFVAVDSTAEPPQAEIDISARKLELERFLGEFGLSEYGRGLISARVALQGQGEGLRSILGSSEGQAGITMEEGALSALIVEALHLDLAEVLTVLFGEEPGTPEQSFGVRCLIANFQVADGIAYERTFVLDTTDSLITVNGAINLGTEAIELDLDTEPKDNSLFAAPSTLYLRGTFGEPKVTPDLTGVGLRGAAAVALGVVLTPLASFLPFIEIGTAENAPCGAMLAQAEQETKVPDSGE
ncbi:AsmA family protein [Geminicoccus roseus]|uniref:AsmA family protein n=1 Tax=Geminicoccus roseus TaxID=404900 RepID=UPI00041A7E73|nr:AsmA family protein [Geminicoccus roseus]